MKIYTKTGDRGATSLVGGKRVSKASERLEAYGTIDELNSHIGLLRATPGTPREALPLLEYIQNKLFNIGAYLATDNTDNPALLPAGLSADASERLEKAIDEADAELPPLRAFILPGGCPAGATANVARTVCRRAERRVIALAREAYVDPNLLRYLNRLSDYLFILARYFNFLSDVAEITWHQED